MAWYDTGTVSVTNGSATVTGSGTNFVSGAQVGEGFYGPDGRLYEIQAIVSATSLTLADNYLGSTQSGQAYKIVPTQSLVANLASQVSTLISDFQTVADEAGEGKFDDGSAASPGITFTQDQDTGFFRETANEIGIAAGGTKIGEFNADGLTVDEVTIAGDLTVDTNTLHVDSANNRVGVGTTSPSELLDVNGDAKINGITVGLGNGTSAANTALGFSTLTSNTTGNSNTATGYLALTTNTTGVSNTAVGREALEANTEGDNNTAIGLRALEANTTGSLNTAVGQNALNSNTTGSNNTAFGNGALAANTVSALSAFGFQALNSNTTGGANSAFGYRALAANTTGDSNVAVGREALEANLTGDNNVAVGLRALEANTTGSSNVAVGYGALLSSDVSNMSAFGHLALTTNTTGTSNSALGYTALRYNTSGAGNTAVGREALTANTTGSSNTAVGLQALSLNQTGQYNTALGRDAGDVLTTGSRNTILGYGCDPSALDGNDQVVVGYNLTGKGNDTAFIGGTGGAYNEKNVTTWETTSDQRIKKNIADNNDGLSVLSQIQVRNFEYRTEDEITDLPSHAAIKQEGVQIGVIAQEIQQVLPECVSENSTGVLSVNTDPLVWYLINAVKELKAEIEQLKGK